MKNAKISPDLSVWQSLPSTAEQYHQHYVRYRQWLSDRAINPANPLSNTQSVNAGGRKVMSGFTNIEAEAMGAALVVARFCPFLKSDGSLEVFELLQMPG